IVVSVTTPMMTSTVAAASATVRQVNDRADGAAMPVQVTRKCSDHSRTAVVAAPSVNRCTTSHDGTGTNTRTSSAVTHAVNQARTRPLPYRPRRVRHRGARPDLPPILPHHCCQSSRVTILHGGVWGGLLSYAGQ